jgi:hypothetical protein
MGTLALVNVYNENGDRLFSLHVQHDGGSSLKKRLENIIDNGRLIGNLGLTKPKLGEAFLSMGCFGASLIALLKNECGDIYITNNTNTLGLYSYTYDIRFDYETNKIVMN